MKMSSTGELNNYKAVDIVKYVAAIMVICIHCNAIVSNVYLDYFINQILCRIAVPFFFVSSAYFIRKGSDNKDGYLKNYLKKLFKSYLIWSIIFIPIGLDWIHQNLTLSQNLLSLALLFGLIHVGTYYHLWYIPALIISVFIVDKLLKRFSYIKIISVSMLLFLFGSLETYYGLVPDSWLKQAFDIIIQIFFTTRSGLLYGMIFIVIGFFIYDHQERLKKLLKYVPALTVLSAILLVFEGILAFPVIKLDMNFLVSLVPFSFFIFIWVLSLPRMVVGDTRKLRELSKYYYFIHTICIVIIEEIGEALQISALRSGLFSFIIIISMTHILSLAIISTRNNPIKRTVFTAALLGMGITFIIADLIYRLKPESIIIKFEFVPCLWAFTSIAGYFMLCQLKIKLNYIKVNNFG